MLVTLKFSDNSKLIFDTDKNLVPWEEMNQKFTSVRLEKLTIGEAADQEDEEGQEDKETQEVDGRNLEVLRKIGMAIKDQGQHRFRVLSLVNFNLGVDETLVILKDMVTINGQLEEFSILAPFGFDEDHPQTLKGLVTAVAANPLKTLGVDATGLNGPSTDMLVTSVIPLIKIASSLQLGMVDQGESTELTAALKEHTHLDTLTLQASNGYMQSALPEIIHNPTLKCLYLCFSEFADGTLGCVAKAIETNRTLTKLGITGYDLEDTSLLQQELNTLATALDVNKTISSFNFLLAHDAFTDSDTDELSDEEVEDALDNLVDALEKNLHFLEFEVDLEAASDSTLDKIEQCLERNRYERGRQLVNALNWELGKLQAALVSTPSTNGYLAVQVPSDPAGDIIVANSSQFVHSLRNSLTATFFRDVQPNQSALGSATAVSLSEQNRGELSEQKRGEEKANTGDNSKKSSFLTMQSSSSS